MVDAVNALVRHLDENGLNKFKDLDFGPKEADPGGRFSFYKDGTFNKPYPDPSKCSWLRPSYRGEAPTSEDQDYQNPAAESSHFCSDGMLFKEGGGANDCVQGKLGDCWFIGALAVLATRRDLLRRVFWGSKDPALKKQQEQYGFRVCRFFKDYEWYYVIIDDKLPVFSNNCKPVFAHCRDVSELWVPFVEKAYAKLHGSYDALIGGYIDGGLRDLTGLVAEEIVLREGHMGFHPQNKIDLESGALWEKMDRYINDWGSMMGCSIQPDPPKKGKKPVKVEQKIGDTGLMMRHAYSVVDVGEIDTPTGPVKLVRLRNPWGFGEWTGAWSDKSRELAANLSAVKQEFSGPVHRYSKGPHKKKNTSYVVESDTDTDIESVDINEKDGTFFMAWTDWCKYFTVIFAAVDFPNEWSGQRVVGEWKQNLSAGGNVSKRTWSSNPKIRFRIVHPDTQCSISLSQDDPRRNEGKNQSKCQDPIGFHILQDPGDGQISPPDKNGSIPGTSPPEQQCVYKLHLSVDVDVFMQPGNYILVPSTYYENRAGPFFLNFYSDKPVAIEGATLIAEEEEQGSKHLQLDYKNSDTTCVAPTEQLNAADLEFEKEKTALIEQLRACRVSMRSLQSSFEARDKDTMVTYKIWKSKLATAGVPPERISKSQFKRLAGDDGHLDADEILRIFDSEVEVDRIFGRTSSGGDESFASESRPEDDERVSGLEDELDAVYDAMEKMREEQARMMHILLLYGKMLKCYDGEIHSPEVLLNKTRPPARKPRKKLMDRTEELLSHHEGGDEFMAVKPWKGAIFPPTNAPKSFDTSAPTESLELEWVYGYQGQSCRNNIGISANGQIVYHAAAVGIIMDANATKQSYHIGHGDDITCLALSHNHSVVATGECGKLPALRIWSPADGQLLSQAKDFHKRAICQAAFSADDSEIITVGGDDDHSIAIYSSPSGAWTDIILVKSSKGDKNPCLFAAAIPTGPFSFVTGGVKHILFWPKASSSAKLRSKKGRFGSRGGDPQPLPCAIGILCGDGTESSVVTGTGSGALLLWANEKCKSSVADAHNGGVHALCADGKGAYVVSGGKEGAIKLWTNSLDKMGTFSLANLSRELKSSNVCVRALAWDDANMRLLVGTLGSEIYQIEGISPDSWTAEDAKIVVQGHCLDEVWGLAAHPTQPHLFLSAGDDKSVRLWDARMKKQVGVAWLRDRCRAVAWSPDGERVACGLGGRVGRRGAKETPGGLVVLRSSLDETEMEDAGSLKKWVSDIKYSPNGKMIAVGAHDSIVWLYDAITLKRKKSRCAKSSSAITHVDWSNDSTQLQTNDLSYELLFYQAKGGVHVPNSSALRDTQWQSMTCPLSWGTEGIWPSDADGTDINAVDRSADSRLLVCGDDQGDVKLFRYPYPASHKGSPQCSIGTGHASHVTNVRFSCDNERIFSTGGNDRAVLQWRVV